MDRYELLETLGDGAFGSVTKAVNKETKELVAIKKMKKKFKNFEECKNLKEKKILEQLKKHENIVKLHEMILVNDTLMFVFEYMEFNLLSLIQNKPDISESQIRGIMQQIICGLAHMHKYGYFHRDLKPENLLCKENKIKIADFGLAKEVRSIPPFTEYVSTRWYRAPECLLRSTHYSSPVDIWALGCIMSELFSKQPLFPGTSERDQLIKISNLLGVPTNWQIGLNLAKKIELKFPININVNSTTINNDLVRLHPNASQDAIDLIKEMLRWDPNTRPTAQALLGHPFFTKNSIQALLSPKKSLDSAKSTSSSGLSFIRKPFRNGTINSSSNVLGLLMNTNILASSNVKHLGSNNRNSIYDRKEDTPDFTKILESLAKQERETDIGGPNSNTEELIDNLCQAGDERENDILESLKKDSTVIKVDDPFMNIGIQSDTQKISGITKPTFLSKETMSNPNPFVNISPIYPYKETFGSENIAYNSKLNSHGLNSNRERERCNYFSQLEDKKKFPNVQNIGFPSSEKQQLINQLLQENREREEVDEIIGQFQSSIIDTNKENRRQKKENAGGSSIPNESNFQANQAATILNNRRKQKMNELTQGSNVYNKISYSD